MLAEAECRGCRWDRLDPKKINPYITLQYWAASNETEQFHEPTASCALSKYVRRFVTFHGVRNYVVRWAFVGSIPILFSTGSIVQYTSGEAGLTRPTIFI